MHHQSVDYYSDLLNEDFEDGQIYTALQPRSCSSISNDERSVESPNIINSFSSNYSELSQQNHDTSFKPYLLSLVDQNCLKETLIGWNMDFLYETCLAECIDIEALQSISTSQIEKLLSTFPMGVKIKFEKNIKQLRNKPEEDSVDRMKRSTVSTSSFSNVPVCHISPQFSLHNVLSNNYHGVMITNYYKSNNTLNESCRSLLIDLIISSLIEKSIPMSVGLANTIAKTIVETFTTELKETYFVRDTDNKAPKGKLYSKYFNKIRSLKNHGLVSEGPCKKSKIEKNILTRTSAAFNDELVVEEDPQIYISQLNHDELSWPDVESIWKKTTVFRLKSFKISNYSATDLQQTWPHYMKPLGYKLVDIDFQCLYKEASNMLNMFDNSKINLIKVIDQRLKDAANKKIYNDMIENSQITESSKSCIIMYLLHAILIPTNKKSTTNSQGKKTIIKYSIQDSQNSFMMVAPTAVEIEEILKRKYNVGDAIQPSCAFVHCKSVANVCVFQSVAQHEVRTKSPESARAGKRLSDSAAIV
ncbi:hypothetical protein ACI65C_001512 [Semiaphis heraclei]